MAILFLVPCIVFGKHMNLIECGKCYRLIRMKYHHKELVYLCKLAFYRGNCQAYERAYRDTSMN